MLFDGQIHNSIILTPLKLYTRISPLMFFQTQPPLSSNMNDFPVISLHNQGFRMCKSQPNFLGHIWTNISGFYLPPALVFAHFSPQVDPKLLNSYLSCVTGPVIKIWPLLGSCVNRRWVWEKLWPWNIYTRSYKEANSALTRAKLKSPEPSPSSHQNNFLFLKFSSFKSSSLRHLPQHINHPDKCHQFNSY